MMMMALHASDHSSRAGLRQITSTRLELDQVRPWHDLSIRVPAAARRGGHQVRVTPACQCEAEAQLRGSQRKIMSSRPGRRQQVCGSDSCRRRRVGPWQRPRRPGGNRRAGGAAPSDSESVAGAGGPVTVTRDSVSGTVTSLAPRQSRCLARRHCRPGPGCDS